MMASTFDNRFFNPVRELPISALDGPSPTRIAPMNFGLGQDRWDRQKNIWQVTPRTFDKPKVSPTRDNNKANVGEVSRVVGRALAVGDYNIAPNASDGLENPLSSSTRPNRPIGPLISPTRPKNNGMLDVGTTEAATMSLGQASLLPGSAPDIEPMNSSSSSSSSSMVPKHHGLTVGRSFRQFNVEEAEEFVPSYLQDHVRHAPRKPYNNGTSVLPYHDMSTAFNGTNAQIDYLRNQPYCGEPARPFQNMCGDRARPGEALDYDRRHLDSGSSTAWTKHQPTYVGTFTDRRVSSLRPDVASYEPLVRSTTSGSQVSYPGTGRYVEHDRIAAHTKAGNTYARAQNHHNTNSFHLSEAADSLTLNGGHYLPPYHSSTCSDGKHCGLMHPVDSNNSSMPRSRNGVNRPQLFAPSAQEWFHSPQYGYGPEVQRPAPCEDSYSVDPVTGALNFHPDGGFALESETKSGPRSEFMDEFRAYHKSKRYELKDIYGYIVEFSGDQNGSRFIQTKLEQANSDEKDQIFSELQSNARQLMSDVFGNYVVQKMFDYGNQSQKKILASHMQGFVLKLSQQAYGCRCVQKAFEHVLTDQQVALVNELDGNVMTVVESQHGNHVIQKAIECIPGEHIQFIIDALKNQIVRLSKHIYGCRIVQRMLEHCSPLVKRSILDELQHAIPSLIVDQFGNYVIQCIIKKCDAADRYHVVEHVRHEVLFYSTHKFASNVVEKALVYAEENQRAEMIQRLTRPSPDHKMQSPVPVLLRDQYGNYVMQTVLKTIQGPSKRALADEVRYHLGFIGKVSRSKQISAMSDTVDAITAGHSPSSTSTGPHTPRTPTSLHSGGSMGTPATRSREVTPPGYGCREPQRNAATFRPAQT